MLSPLGDEPSYVFAPGYGPGTRGPYADGYRTGGGLGSRPGAPAGAAAGLGPAGAALAIIGIAQQTIGGYYRALSQRYEARSAALRADAEQSASWENARRAEGEAQQILQQGADSAALRTLEGGQEAAAVRASTAGRGVKLGVGSTAEVAASIDFATQSDALKIRQNAARAAGNARLQAVDFKARARTSALSADMLRRQARLSNPWLSAAQGLLGGASEVAPQWIYQERS